METKDKLKCSIIGHRTIEVTKNLEDRLTQIFCHLIENRNVETFNFTTNSQFVKLCHKIISQLKEHKYFFVKRVVYSCGCESCFLESEKQEMEKIISTLTKRKTQLQCYDKIIHDIENLNAGKVTYIKRNQKMINESDICLFYVNKEYLKNKNYTSGTELALNYAKLKNKSIIIVDY